MRQKPARSNKTKLDLAQIRSRGARGPKIDSESDDLKADQPQEGSRDSRKSLRQPSIADFLRSSKQNKVMALRKPGGQPIATDTPLPGTPFKLNEPMHSFLAASWEDIRQMRQINVADAEAYNEEAKFPPASPSSDLTVASRKSKPRRSISCPALLAPPISTQTFTTTPAPLNPSLEQTEIPARGLAGNLKTVQAWVHAAQGDSILLQSSQTPPPPVCADSALTVQSEEFPAQFTSDITSTIDLCDPPPTRRCSLTRSEEQTS